MQKHNDVKAPEVSTSAGTPCLTTTTGERRAPREDAPARHLVRSRVRWLAGLLLIVLVGTPSAFAFPTCGDGECQDTGPFAETDTSCPVDCGGSPPPCHDLCENEACTHPASGVDNDYDGVPDRLEYDLAHKFFPDLWLQTFTYDLEESYFRHNKALPYMVHPYREPETACDEAHECLEIRYGIAYFKDHGLYSFNPLCPLGCVVGAHVGDSEFYTALVRRTTPYPTAHTDPASWRLIRDFTAAHQGTASDSSRLGAYGSAAFACPIASERYAWTPLFSRATVFASGRKHGLYHTIDECEEGAFYTDWCESSTDSMYNLQNYKTANLLQNIGTKAYKTAFDGTIQNPYGCGAYFIWGGAEFGTASPYDEKFLNPMDWCLPPAFDPPSTCPTITVLPTALPMGTLGMAYEKIFTQTGGFGTEVWSISAGTLPSGVTFKATSGVGVLTGTPTVSGTFPFTVRASNGGCFGEHTYTLVVKQGSSTDLFAFPNPVEAGQPLALEAEVRTFTGGIPTGTVSFSITDIESASPTKTERVNMNSLAPHEFLGTAMLEGGVAYLTIIAPAVGYSYEVSDRIIRAYYSGDGHFHPSSADLPLTIQPGSGPIE